MIERYKPEQCFVSYAHTDNYNQIKGTVVNLYPYLELYNKADYSTHIFYNECPPLDEELLNSMLECERTVIKMMEGNNPRPDQPPDYDKRIRTYHRHLRYWNYVLDAGKIEIVAFSDAPHGIYDYIVYCLCKKKGIATVFPYFGTVLGYLYFSKDLNFHCPELPAVYQKLALELKDMPIDKIELLPDFQKKFEALSNITISSAEKAPYYMSFHYSSLMQNIKANIQSRMNKFIHRMTYHVKKGLPDVLSTIRKILFDHYLLRAIKKLIIERHRTKKLFRIYDSLAVVPDYTKPYVYYPLHYQPECSTSPLGGVFVYQLLVAEMLSAHLPEGSYLYVKEHPVQKSYLRNPQLYSDLAALPNVKLVHRAADTYQLMEHSVAVASVTGTAGFEGQFIVKPFLMFGTYINMHAPGTFNIRNNEDCQKALEYVFRHGAKHTLKDMKIYLKALSEVMPCCSIDIENWTTSTNDEDNISCIAREMTRVLDEQLAIPRTSEI